MNKTKATDFFKGIQNALTKYSPEILTGIGIAGMITTTVVAVKMTPKALSLMDKELKRQNKELADETERNGKVGFDEIVKLKPVDVIRVTWKCYIPAVTVGAASIACLIGASSVHSKRNAVLATAYKLSETAFSEYKEKVIETIGEKKEEVIRDKVHKERMEKDPVSKNEVFISDSGDTLCYDYNTGRYFKSDIEKIRRAVNTLNKKMLSEGYVSLNDFYEEIGIDRTSTGDRLGWNTDSALLDLNFSSQLTNDGKPCLVIDFKVAPKYDFDRFF